VLWEQLATFCDMSRNALYDEMLAETSYKGRFPDDACAGVAGGEACGNTIIFRVKVSGSAVSDCGFTVDGSRDLRAAAAWTAQHLTGLDLFDAASFSSHMVVEALCLHDNQHVANLIEDAVHVALGRAAYEHGSAHKDPARVFVAMSGGVDSSVVALLASQKNMSPVGVTLELWRDDTIDGGAKSCCSASAVRSARAQAHKLGLPHFTLDLRKEFEDGVVQPYIQSHRDGLTPNPCVNCNGDVRLDAMIDFAVALGGVSLQTGHYARIQHDSLGPLLAAAADPRKDQTYMLSRLHSEKLSALQFPLGELTKPQVREIASQNGLFAADAPDSQDLCFLAGTDKTAFLKRHGGITTKTGDILDEDGIVVGKHSGAHLYTVGQRKGLGISRPDGKPVYVLSVNADSNTVVVSTEKPKNSELLLRGVRLHRPGARVNKVRIRYHSDAYACSTDNVQAGHYSKLAVVLRESADGNVVPGQSAQLLDGDLVVGQGFIGR
jgi:tRNA-specific 2-thiouridylase